MKRLERPIRHKFDSRRHVELHLPRRICRSRADPVSPGHSCPSSCHPLHPVALTVRCLLTVGHMSGRYYRSNSAV